MENDPAEDEGYKNAARLLGMIDCLHEKGYGLIRIMPYISGMGTWRCKIGCKQDFDKEYGIRTINQDASKYVYYTSAAGCHYFKCDGVETMTEEQLAERFIIEFPEIAKDGQGQDAPYAAWFKQILSEARQNNLLYVLDEFFNTLQSGYLDSTNGKHLPLPDGK